MLTEEQKEFLPDYRGRKIHMSSRLRSKDGTEWKVVLLGGKRYAQSICGAKFRDLDPDLVGKEKLIVIS